MNLGYHGMKFRPSGNGPAMGTSKNGLGSGWIVSSPSDSKKMAICSWAPRAIAPKAYGNGMNPWGSFGSVGFSANARSWR